MLSRTYCVWLVSPISVATMSFFRGSSKTIVFGGISYFAHREAPADGKQEPVI